MIDDDNFDEWLPEGWRAEEKVIRNGKKYKCYFPPNGDGIFYSKLEVLRYLKKDHPRTDHQQSSKNSVVEKTVAKELPPGWTKEIKITKKGHKIRRDAFYTDPVSGYVFRSMKDALRYLETGEIGKLALKPKDKDNNDGELEKDDTDVGELVSELNLRKLATDDQKSDSDCVKESGIRSESSASELLEKDPKQLAMESDYSKTAASVTSVIESPSDKQTFGTELTKDDSKKTMSSKTEKKKELSLPRRASKRLAGVPVEPSPELKTRRTRRASVEKSSDVSSKGESSTSTVSHPDVTKVDDNCEGRNLAVMEEDKGKITSNKDTKDNVKLPLDLPLQELWQDPCIAFAIRTLTGVSFEYSDTSTLSPFPNSCDHGGSTTADNNTPVKEMTNGVNMNRSITDQPQQNPPNTEVHLGDFEVPNKTEEKPGSALDLPFAEAWGDPCIEFAIKTLTGAIPLNCDMVIQNRVPSQCTSSQANGGS